jgi:Domain of unknown function (DUF4126)
MGFPNDIMTVIAAVAAGIGLAACSGLRAFLPLLLAGLAARFLDWPLAPEVAWLASTGVLVALLVATAAELAADKVPILDHALDAVHTVLGPAAAVLTSVSAWAHLTPQHAVLVALLAGAPIALGVHALAAVTRIKSTVLSAGAANSALSVVEDAATVSGVALAVTAPVVLAVVLVVLLAIAVWWTVARAKRRSLRPAAPKNGR